MNKALTDDELDLLRQEWDHANSELDDDTSDAWEVMCAKAGNDLLRLLNTVTAARDHAAISIARSASDGLAKEAAESALEATKRAIVRDLWPHLDFQYPQITFAIQRAGETIAAAQAEAAMLAVLLTRWVEWMNDERWVTKGSAYPHLLPDTVAALAARDPQEKR